MRELSIKFIFQGLGGEEMTNDTMFQLRQELARILNICEFGAIIQHADGTFENDFANPVIDTFIAFENELHISFLWLYPLTLGHGDIVTLITQYVPGLATFAENHNASLTFRTAFT